MKLEFGQVILCACIRNLQSVILGSSPPFLALKLREEATRNSSWRLQVSYFALFSISPQTHTYIHRSENKKAEVLKCSWIDCTDFSISLKQIYMYT
jgi:hypothetical protein